MNIFFIKWSFIIFCWGGIGSIIWALLSLKKQSAFVQIDLKKLKASLKILIAFVVLATIGFLEIFTIQMGSLSLQLVNNIFTGVIFILFIYKLKNAIKINR